MKKVKAALVGLVLIAASIIGIASAQPAGAIVCSPGQFLGSTDLLWHSGTQSSVHGAMDTWCNANGDDYGAIHYNFDLFPHDGSPYFSNFDTWMDWTYSRISVFADHIIRIDGFQSHSVVIDTLERTYDYTWHSMSYYDYVTYGVVPELQNGSVQFGCMPHGRCYGWDWGNIEGAHWWEVEITF